MPLSPNSRLGTYEILGPLGAGGMGEVYRARDTRLGREVAIKVLPEDVASSPDRLARFEREARTVAGLNHPNIVVLHSIEEAAGIRFLTMELVVGDSLADLMVPGGLPLTRILDIAIPLTEALVATHENGVIHRDLKPGNVMVARGGRVKVLDFGLAKMRARDTAEGDAVTSTAESTLSHEGQLLGTVPYMAPEQVRGEAVDARSDLFSLGVVLYELAAGRRPFDGGSVAEVMSSVLRDTPEPLTRLRADLPDDFGRVVVRCLEKNPRERIQSALDVQNDLRRLRVSLERGGHEKAASAMVTSIAVLPFVNRSRNQEDEYFSDGLADELLNVLSKIEGLRVSARASSFYFKGKDALLGDIGRALNVATVLDGSVRKAGNRVRISVQLVKVSDGYHLWSKTYDRTLDDIFAVQDDIAQSVVRELRTLLGGVDGAERGNQAKADVAKAAKGRGTHPEAHRLYLLARHLIDRHTRDEMARAVEYLKQAIAFDPGFALAWAELSRAYANEADWGWAQPAEKIASARKAMEQALSLEPDLAEGHAHMGWIQMTYDWDFRGAEASYARALELAPENAMVLRGAAVLAKDLGRIEDAIVLCRRAVERDPLSAPSYKNLGIALHEADRFTEAEEAYRKVADLSPHSLGKGAILSMTLVALGRGDEAVAAAAGEPWEPVRLWALAIVHDALGHGPESDAALRELIEKHAQDSAYQVAEVHGVRGEVDAAFQWLERAYAQRDGGLTKMKTSPRLRPLHRDPRWGMFLKKMGLED